MPGWIDRLFDYLGRFNSEPKGLQLTTSQMVIAIPIILGFIIAMYTAWPHRENSELMPTVVADHMSTVVSPATVAVSLVPDVVNPHEGESLWRLHHEKGLGKLIRTSPTVVFEYQAHGKIQKLELDEKMSALWLKNRHRLGNCTNDPLLSYENIGGLNGSGEGIMFAYGALITPHTLTTYYLDDTSFIEAVNRP